jgi:hypothetical protein
VLLYALKGATVAFFLRLTVSCDAVVFDGHGYQAVSDRALTIILMLCGALAGALLGAWVRWCTWDIPECKL